jgi:hypothetical protein
VYAARRSLDHPWVVSRTPGSSGRPVAGQSDPKQQYEDPPDAPHDRAIRMDFTIKNGRVVREQAFRNRDEALEAAGLRD